jgi:hypothetical protein
MPLWEELFTALAGGRPIPVSLTGTSPTP